MTTRRSQTTEADRIADAVMTSDLDPETKVKIFALIAGVKHDRSTAKKPAIARSKTITVRRIVHDPPKKTPGRRLHIDVIENHTATPRGKTAAGLLDIEVRCPECGSLYGVPPWKARRKHACPFCGKHVKVR